MEDNTPNSAEFAVSTENNSEWQKKKQDIMLNLGLSSKSAQIADETPTPTRFIQNCEEVGLFQDLQNVNPFDEVFKRAVENSNSNMLEPNLKSTSDDTLHTPQIYPQPDESQNKFTNSNINMSSQEFGLNPVITSISETKNDCDVLVINSDHEENSGHTTNVKAKIKSVLMEKYKAQINLVHINRLQQNPQKSIDLKVENSEAMRIREANRAAQMRCRKRKQKEHQDMKIEMQELKREKLKLLWINHNLQNKIKLLEEKLQEKSMGLQQQGISAELNQHCLGAITLASPVPSLETTIPIQSTLPSEVSKTAHMVISKDSGKLNAVNSAVKPHSELARSAMTIGPVVPQPLFDLDKSRRYVRISPKSKR
ncbi:uncharacterized protein LOC132708435 isoform X2 [Cylas formicarius]|uniref:uncharacterized protein LOC132708435 isoform X2 n=1 Tax=Cylas formicarius TaxID=197179 RepID=UPI002958851E|nr:uncharacterized protein LOC132708435 isoform X2 [Cylas formicarius]